VVKRFLSLLEGLTLGIAIVCVAMIMLVVAYDAIARYVFHAPLGWGFELITYYVLGAANYLAISATFRSGDHVNIDLFRSMMSQKFRARVDIVWSIFAALVFAFIAYGAYEEMVNAWRGKVFLPGYITWPAWAAYPPIVIGFSLSSFRLIAYALTLLIKGHDEDVIDQFNAGLQEHQE